jgi:prevent-host-death family protein
LQDAKARFSEVVRRAKSDGPQIVTVRGRDEVVVVAAEEFRRLNGEPTGQALVNVLRKSPLRDRDLDHKSARSLVRVVIPGAVRRQLPLREGSTLGVKGEGKRLVLEPVLDGAIAEHQGLLIATGSLVGVPVDHRAVRSERARKLTRG